MSENSYYSVAVGREPGIYNTWNETEKNISGYSGAKYKKFKNYEDAVNFLNENNKEINYSKPKKIISDYFYNLDRTTDKDNSIREKHNLISKKIFTEEDIKTPEIYSFKENVIDVFTDGCCINNGKKKWKKAGYGIYFPLKQKFNVSNPFNIEPLTNNRAELFAMIHLFNLIPYFINDLSTQVTIYTDSKYCINIHNRALNMISRYSKKDLFEIMDKHKKHKFFNYIDKENILEKKINDHLSLIDQEKEHSYVFPEIRELKNIDLVIEFVYAIKLTKIKYIIKHVKAHQKNDNYLSVNNNKVDRLANEGSEKKNFNIIENDFT
jgi:ribonuclease HI